MRQHKENLMIRNLLNSNSMMFQLFRDINLNKKISLLNLSDGEITEILGEIDRPILLVVPNEEEGNKYIDKLQKIKLTTNYCFVLPDLLLSDYSVSASNYYRFISNLADDKINVHIITPNVLMCECINKIDINNNSLTLSCDQEISIDHISELLSNMGYIRVESISNNNQYSIRGDILDVFPSMSDNAYRILFDYDTIDRIKMLDDELVSTVSSVESITLTSNSIFHPDTELMRKNVKNMPELTATLDNYIELNNNYNSLWFLPFQQNKSNIWDLIPDNTVVAYTDVKLIYDNASKELKNYSDRISEAKNNKLLTKLHNNPLHLDNLYADNNNFAVIGFQYINNANKIFSPNAVYSFKNLPTINYGENYTTLIIDLQNYQKMNFTTIIFCSNDNINILTARIQDMPYNKCKNTNECVIGQINIIEKEYNNSAIFYEDKIAIIGSNSIGKHYYANVSKIAKSINKSSFSDLELPQENDYVVHKIHGIGKCLGIKTLTLSNNITKDYIVIEYRGEDKLYLPIENIDSITKYVGSDELPQLNKLGGVEFQKAKEKVAAKVKDIANDLIAIYKERENTKGVVYSVDDDIQKEFERQFPYELTLDQKIAIEEIKKEMCNGKLIDRLICGDVGFGKTEVAMQIAFKTILDGKMVAMLCPTTILSEQHYNTFVNRMKPFGVNVAVLNRFKTAAEVKQIINDLENGQINIIIGTHKLLNNKIKFKNLGLLIIDEEQKFGVEHKELLKKMRKNINVLTLSATPIPRTLHLSLTGIRDISTIQTPPPNKHSTNVSVSEYNDAILKLAIDKELARGGQVLVIYNRIESIDLIASKIAELTDNQYIIDVAHGQMSATELENKIFKLYNGDTQILVSTTLIENGVDLPNANTLIILDADKLGLSQLYQLKGRVGRGNRDSYAYFMYRGTLSDIAYKRLKAISEYTAMGSGGRIALRDMELRGAGNIFGSEQHGHMLKVGYAMYLSILNNTIAEIKGEKDKYNLINEIKIETDLPINIPNEIQYNTNQKMAIYSKISRVSNLEEYKELIQEIGEIYSEIPTSLDNLCKFSLIKNKLARTHCVRLIVKENICRIDFAPNTTLEELSNLLNTNAILNTQNGISIEIKGVDNKIILDYLLNYLNVL